MGNKRSRTHLMYLAMEFGYFFTISHGMTGSTAPMRKKNVSAAEP
jgi:hypothetical protein